MKDFNNKPESQAEKMIWEVFAGREQEAESKFSRLRLENSLRAEVRRPVSPGMNVFVKVSAFMCALLIFGGWAGNLSVPSYDDGQQIIIELPDNWVAAEYPYWVGVFSNHADELLEHGGHSLVVDYSQNEDGSYFLELGLIGVDYQQANEWIRSVMESEPEVQGLYSMTQPMVRYRVRVADMIAFRLGSSEAVERNVVRAWLSDGNEALAPRHVYLIAQPKDYARRVSMIDF